MTRNETRFAVAMIVAAIVWMTAHGVARVAAAFMERGW